MIEPTNEQLEQTIINTFNDMGIMFGSKAEGEAFFQAFRRSCLQYYEDNHKEKKPKPLCLPH